MEWISIEDKLPEKGDEAVFTNEKVNEKTGIFIHSYGYYVFDDKFKSYVTNSIMRATHYLIPQPPKQD